MERTSVRTLIAILIALPFVWAFNNIGYMSGFDDGAAAAQCLDLHAWAGSEEAMKSDACKDAAEAQKSLRFKLYGHRVFWK